MTKVLTTAEYEKIEKKNSNQLVMTLVKRRMYSVVPYGKFVIKSKTRQGYLPNIIPLDELQIRHDTSMPLTPEQDKEVVKLMKKFKTDILTDGRDYYTRVGSGFTEVYHKKLAMYGYDESFKNQVDNGHTWGAIVLNNVK